MNVRMSLFGGGIMILLTGIALWVYGYNVEPTAGQAIGNIFSGNFTDKRNGLMLAGLIIAAVGGAGVFGGAVTGTRTGRA
jgi:hypothetical protein